MESTEHSNLITGAPNFPQAPAPIFHVPVTDHFEVIGEKDNMPREDWLRLRREGLGGSDCAAIMGLNDYSTAFDVWADKLGYMPDREETDAMRWGTILEPIILEEFDRNTKIPTFKISQIFRSRKHPFMQLNLDGVLFDGGEIGLTEIKTSGRGFGWEEGPATYAHLQCLHGLAVTGWVYGYVIVLLRGQELQWWRIERDEALIDNIINVEGEFWEKVTSKIPPEVQAGDLDSIKELHKKLIADPVIIPARYEEKFRLFDEMKGELKKITAEKEKLEAECRILTGGAVSAICGKAKVSYKPVPANSFNSKQLAIDMPEVHEKYFRKNMTRRFSVTFAKE